MTITDSAVDIPDGSNQINLSNHGPMRESLSVERLGFHLETLNAHVGELSNHIGSIIERLSRLENSEPKKNGDLRTALIGLVENADNLLKHTKFNTFDLQERTVLQERLRLSLDNALRELQ